MVGVAGKSQACNTCKRRRVKCDLQRPTCLRCEKAKTTCAGYERDPIFINQTPTQHSVTAASAISEAKREDSKRGLLPIYEEDMRLLISQATNQSSYLPEEFRRNAVELLKKIYLPRPLPENYGLSPNYAWLASLSTLTEKSQALDLSILAFCIIQTQLTNTASFSLEEGLQIYSEALRHHRTDLQDGQKISRDETFAAIVVLTTCELFTFPFDRSWRVHAFGISEILRLRGQSVPQTQTWYSLCSRLRLVCILDGLTKQQPLFLSSSEWLDISRSIYSQPINKLLDIVTNVPASLAQSNALVGDPHPEQRDGEMASIVKEFIGVANQMYIWLRHTKDTSSRMAYWAVPSRIHNPADEYPPKLFPFTLEFDSLNSAMMLSLTWAIHLQIFNKIIQIHRWFLSHAASLPCMHEIFGHDVQQDLQTDSTGEFSYMNLEKISISLIKTEAEKLGRLLCQCIGYCYRADMGTLGLQSARYLQWVSREFFRQSAGYERELAWILHIKYITGPGLHDKLDLIEFEDNP